MVFEVVETHCEEGEQLEGQDGGDDDGKGTEGVRTVGVIYRVRDRGCAGRGGVIYGWVGMYLDGHDDEDGVGAGVEEGDGPEGGVVQLVHRGEGETPHSRRGREGSEGGSSSSSGSSICTPTTTTSATTSTSCSHSHTITIATAGHRQAVVGLATTTAAAPGIIYP